MKSSLLSWPRVFPPIFTALLLMLPNPGRAQSISNYLAISIVSPTNGAYYPSPTDIALVAGVQESNDAVTSVAFFDGSQEIGVATNGIVVDPPGAPGLPPQSRAYFFDWTNQAPGIHVLTAIATDTNDISVTSSPVTITVSNLTIPPPATVEITQPTNGSAFTLPTDIQIDVLVSNPPPDMADVSFVAVPAGTGILPQIAIYLGSVSNFTSPSPSARIYTLNCSNAPMGTWSIVASAVRSNGADAGSSSVTITVSNLTIPPPPIVEITQPTNGSTFAAPADIQIDALVSNPPPDMAYVSFYANPAGTGVLPQFAIELGIVSNFTSPSPSARIYTLNWSNAPMGMWSIVASAFRSNGVDAGSALVQITVGNPTTIPPVVRITSPANNSEFRAPVNITLLAYASAPDSAVESVEFFEGSNSLGFGQPLPEPVAEPLNPSGPSLPVLPDQSVTNIFELIWSNAPPGAYALTALALDDVGGSVTSAPINLTVLPALTPPTNGLDIVRIVATDPIAISGTNCWRWLGGPPTWSNWMSPTALFHWYTNCGPKDATFTVSRFGSTNSDLTVDYDIGGTATNGVDYATLPGTVNIPAGQTEAMITVIPLSATAPNIAQTVVLTLAPTPDALVDYVIGIPRRAEAIIIATNGPEPLSAVLPGGSFHLSLAGPDGAWFHIDYTTNLINWTPICTNQVIDGLIDFIDPDAATSPTREYRAVPMANPPSD